MNYRVLDLDKNEYIDETGLALTSKGELISLGTLPKNYDIHQGINFEGIAEHTLYVGDAISLKLKDTFMQEYMVNLLEILGANFVPQNFNELIVQIVKDNDSIPFYWLMFKKEGDFILDKHIEDKQFLTEECDEEGLGIRAIPMGDITNVRKILSGKPFEVIYNCTDPQWIKHM